MCELELESIGRQGAICNPKNSQTRYGNQEHTERPGLQVVIAIWDRFVYNSN